MPKSFIEPHAVGSSKLSDRFFAVVERIYSFFFVSTHRYRSVKRIVWIKRRSWYSRRCSWHFYFRCDSVFHFFSFLTFWKVILRESHEAQTNLQQKGLSLSQCSHKLKAFVAFFNWETKWSGQSPLMPRLKYVKIKVFLLKNGDCVKKEYGWRKRGRRRSNRCWRSETMYVWSFGQI